MTVSGCTARFLFFCFYILWLKTVIDDTYVQKCTKLGARSILGNVAKCCFLKSKRRPSVFNLRVRVCLRVIFRLGLELLFKE